MKRKLTIVIKELPTFKNYFMEWSSFFFKHETLMGFLHIINSIVTQHWPSRFEI